MNRKNMYLHIALCIFTGIVAGVGLAFRFQFNPYAAAAIGGFIGAFTFRPKEVFSLCCQCVRDNYKDALTLLVLIPILAASLACHYSIAKHIPDGDFSLGSRIFLLYLAGFVTLIIEAMIISNCSFITPSWKMPILNRLRARLDRKGTVFENHSKLAGSLYAIFFAPIFVCRASVILSIVLVDFVLTIAMFACATPQLAIFMGAAAGTLAGCCFCGSALSAIMLGSALGIPLSLGAQKLRWFLASEWDRQKLLEKSAATA